MDAKAVAMVALGGALGSVCRYLCVTFAGQTFGAAFPWGTLLVNIVGCFVMGVVAGVIAEFTAVSSQVRLFLTTGFLGGFTTFSAFALDVATLSEKSLPLSALYVCASVLASMIALYFGLALAKLFA